MDIQDEVKDYYGKVLKSSEDLKTDACCTVDSVPSYVRPLLANVHDEVSAKYYGCGLVTPLALQGARVLDLGSGSGQDAYVLAQLVGAEGAIVGVDMTAEQLAVANRHLDWHSEKFGYANVTFLEGDIERLSGLELEAGSFDVVVSNCVINLVADKEAVFRAVHSLLKPGGEFYFSDVYADRRLSQELRNDPVALGECLGGALYFNDFLQLSSQAGFADARLVTHRELAIQNDELEARLAPARFQSATYRLFRAEGLELGSEDYGHVAVYQGGIAESDAVFEFDIDHQFKRGEETRVSGNTLKMLEASRFSGFFEFRTGDSHQGASQEPTRNPFRDSAASAKPASKGCC